MKTIQIEIDSAKRSLQKAIAELKRLYNDPRALLGEMNDIMDYTRLLDSTDFEKTITE